MEGVRMASSLGIESTRSLADVRAQSSCPLYPNSRHRRANNPCPLSANSGRGRAIAHLASAHIWPTYSINSSASASKLEGIVKPRALAVLRLITVRISWAVRPEGPLALRPSVFFPRNLLPDGSAVADPLRTTSNRPPPQNSCFHKWLGAGPSSRDRRFAGSGQELERILERDQTGSAGLGRGVDAG